MSDLQTWMDDAGEKDDTLALKLGVSRVQVFRIRSRQCNPSPGLAQKIEDLSAGAVSAMDLLLRERVAPTPRESAA